MQNRIFWKIVAALESLERIERNCNTLSAKHLHKIRINITFEILRYSKTFILT